MSSSEETILCPNCDQNIEKAKYFLHERMCSLNVKKCPKCNKPFNNDDLNEHIKSKHTYIVCDLCNMKFPNSIIEEHKNNCSCRLIPCKYCELNVMFKELEEHENICGSTTEKCLKCGLYIEKKNISKHICLDKETEFLNENLKIINNEDEKKEKKKIKHGLEKNSYKKNKVFIDFGDSNKNTKKIKENEIKNNINEFNFLENKKKNKKNKKKSSNINNFDINKNEDKMDIEMDMMLSPEEIQNQIDAFNNFEKMNENNNINNNNDKPKKKKKNKKKDKEYDFEEIEKQNEKPKKKGKKSKQMGGKNFKNKISKNDEDNKFIGEDEYYTGKKNMNLHNIKCDIPPNEYKNYNNVINDYNYGFDYNLEDNMIQEAIKRSLEDK